MKEKPREFFLFSYFFFLIENDFCVTTSCWLLLCNSRKCICMYIPTLLPLTPYPPPHPSPRSSQDANLGSLLCYTAASHLLAIVLMVVCIRVQCYSLSHPILSPSLCLQAHSLHLPLYSRPENKFINTSFLDLLYMCINLWHILFFF